jgi:hypothetical protein
MVSGVAIVEVPVSDGTLEANYSEAETGIASKVSPCMMNECSEDNHRLEKVQLE